jgi:hypothetical protein
MAVAAMAMGWREWLMAIGAWVLIALASLLLRLVHFRHLAGLLGRPLGAVACVPLIDGREEARAVLVHRAVSRAVQISPWRADCLPQALAAAVLCRFLRVPAAVHFGVALPKGERMSAHAWAVSGPIAVTGGASFREFTAVACFASGFRTP